MRIYVYHRPEDRETGTPAGLTISRRDKLPDGEFTITEYRWDSVRFWFVDQDHFTDDERQKVYDSIQARK